MKNNSDLQPKYGNPSRMGGHLILLILAIALLFVWRTGLVRGDASVDPSGSETAVIPAASREFDPVIGSVPDVPVADLPVISDESLSPVLNPFTLQGEQPAPIDFQTYVVERGDTPNAIADRFGITPETLLGGNPQLSQESSLLQTGVELRILPIDGVLHAVQPGESIEGIAAQYGVTVDDIVGYDSNNLEFPYRLYPETEIMVPGGVREVFVWTPPDLSSVLSRGSSNEGSRVTPLVIGTGTFIFPVSSRNFTQYHWYGHQAIDIGLVEGSAVYAADTGTVTYAGWNTYGYGNLIVVNHGNGYETFYAHLSGFNVGPGQIVYQGNVIGATGNTGNSSGPHIHFEIRLYNNRDNPCWYIGC